MYGAVFFFPFLDNIYKLIGWPREMSAGWWNPDVWYRADCIYGRLYLSCLFM